MFLSKDQVVEQHTGVRVGAAAGAEAGAVRAACRPSTFCRMVWMPEAPAIQRNIVQQTYKLQTN